jgi:tRNA (adenine37-N6)-methyltransferase
MLETLTLHPIGFIRTEPKGEGAPQKFHAPHQPVEDDLGQRNVLELLPDPRLQVGLADLEGFSRVWLLWWFHRSAGWHPKVLPPRGPPVKRGVFATRSPRRINPIGLTPVPLLGIEGRKLYLGACDAIDGTPVFDIKPYIPLRDSFPNERAGWTEENEAAYLLPPRYRVHLSPLAVAQADWLASEWRIDFSPRVQELLGRDPSPHRTRRIRRTHEGQRRIECGAWRAWFEVEGLEVTVTAIEPGYPESLLMKEGYDAIPDRSAQLAFLLKWGSRNVRL